MTVNMVLTIVLAAVAGILFGYAAGRCHEGCREGGTLDLWDALDAAEDALENDAETISLLARERDQLRSAVLQVPGRCHKQAKKKRDWTVLPFRRALNAERLL